MAEKIHDFVSKRRSVHWYYHQSPQGKVFSPKREYISCCNVYSPQTLHHETNPGLLSRLLAFITTISHTETCRSEDLILKIGGFCKNQYSVGWTNIWAYCQLQNVENGLCYAYSMSADERVFADFPHVVICGFAGCGGKWICPIV